MATVARSFSRTALSCTRQASPRQAPTSCACSYTVSQLSQHRKFSTTPIAFNQENGEGEAQASSASSDGAAESGEGESAPRNPNQTSNEAREFQSIRQKIRDMDRSTKMGYISDHPIVPKDEIFSLPHSDDSITSMGHAGLEEHRQVREYARLAAWHMPTLSNLAKPFVPPSLNQPLRFRYTTYLGESHPAETKVVMEVCSKDLTPSQLTEEQRITLLKLVGPRYNPEKDLIRMSCEKFPTRAQNKRYLGDLIEKLITEAKTGDSFADVPLDLRHHKPKPKYSWPKEWNMTGERKAELEAIRNKNQKLLGSVTVDGNTAVDEAITKIPALSSVMAPRAGGAAPGGKPGKPGRPGRGGNRPRGR